jgi:hypothetical protein
MMKLAQKLFIECFSMVRILPDILKEEEGLGAHTAVILASQTFGIRYFWCHPSVRPLGINKAPQCPNCHAVRTLSFTSLTTGSRDFTISCNCGWVEELSMGNPKAILPKVMNGAVIGWANELLYGMKADVDKVWSAHRDFYDRL